MYINSKFWPNVAIPYSNLQTSCHIFLLGAYLLILQPTVFNNLSHRTANKHITFISVEMTFTSITVLFLLLAIVTYWMPVLNEGQ